MQLGNEELEFLKEEIDTASQETSLIPDQDDLTHVLRYLSETMNEGEQNIEKSQAMLGYDELKFKSESTDTPHLSSLLNVGK